MPIKPNDGGGEPITVTTGTTIEVSAHGSDWFPVRIRSGMHHTTIYLRRAQLVAFIAQINDCLLNSNPPEPWDPGEPEDPHDDWSVKRGDEL
jgi:hypothetical protein